MSGPVSEWAIAIRMSATLQIKGFSFKAFLFL